MPALNETHATLVQYIKPNVDKEAGKCRLFLNLISFCQDLFVFSINKQKVIKIRIKKIKILRQLTVK